jgi:Ca2+-binding EF-hand superfamily protein
MISNMKRPAMLLAAVLASASAAAQTQMPAATPAKAAPVAAQAGPEATFNRWDKDKNKALSLDEFKVGWQEVQAAMVLRKLHETFVAMDANKSGSLEATEYSNLELVKKSGKSAPQMATFDTDKNQSLSFKEYVAMIQAILSSKR